MFESGEWTVPGGPAGAGGRVESSELVAVVDILRRAAVHGVNSGGLAGDCDLLAGLGELRNISEVLTATCLHEADLRGSTEIAHGLKARRWFSRSAMCAGGTAARLHQLGSTLADFPLLAAACVEGRVGVDHLDVVRRAVNPRIRAELIGLDSELCELACRFEVREFTRAVARIVAMIDVDGPAPDCRDTDTLRVAADLSGGVHLDGWFSGENAVHLAHALNTEMARQRRLARADADAGIAMPSASVLRARALMALLAAGHTTGGGAAAPATRADAVVVIEGHLDPHDQIVTHPTQSVSTLDGDPIDPVTAVVLLCDAHLSPFVCDHTGRPLHYGRTRRFATTHQIRALAIRDRGCVVPGCDAPASQCHAHHEPPPWHAGGRTDIDHMALLCAHHHGRIHGPDWQLHPAPGDSPHHHELTNTRTGQQFHIGSRHQPHGTDPDPPDP